MQTDAAVSDVLGSVLLVGITVVMAAAFGAVLFAHDGPADLQHTRLAVTVTPGAGGWGGGDEELRVRHLGGEAVAASDALIAYEVGGARTTVRGAQLGSAFADGRLTIGETWMRTLRAAAHDAVDVSVVVQGEVGQLLAATRVVAGSGGVLCIGDAQAPAVAFTQSPADVTSQTLGGVTVTARVMDACAGTDDAVVPRLRWCVDVACAVPGSFTDQGPMARTAPGVWTGTVPARAWAADAVSGKTLRYYVQPVADLNGNSGASDVATDLVDLVYTYTYVTAAAATHGVVADLDNARSSGNGAEASIAEVGATGSPGTVGPTRVPGVSAVSATAATPANALASDDARADMGVTGGFLEVSGFDLPANAATVTAVSIGIEARKSGSGGTDPTARLDHRIGTGTYVTGANFAVTNSGADVQYARALTGPFTVANVEAMTLRVFHVTDTNRNLQVDQAYVTVTYTTPPQTEYRMDVALEFDGIPGGSGHTVDLRYRTAGDTFTAQAFNFATSTWRTCPGTLAASTLSSFTCALQANEASLGEARLRLLDSTPTGTTPGTLFLDHARVATL